jgi:hypothetical protein
LGYPTTGFARVFLFLRRAASFDGFLLLVSQRQLYWLSCTRKGDDRWVRRLRSAASVQQKKGYSRGGSGSFWDFCGVRLRSTASFNQDGRRRLYWLSCTRKGDDCWVRRLGSAASVQQNNQGGLWGAGNDI